MRNRRRNRNSSRRSCSRKKVKISRTMMSAVGADGDLLQLNQILMPRQMKSVFNVIDSKGPAHCPLFTIRLSIYDKDGVICSETIGIGKNKKSARQIAAKNYLQKLSNNNNNDSNCSDPKSQNDKNASAQVQHNELDEHHLGNAIGALEAFCRVKGLEKPMYEFRMFLSTVSPIFQCDCKVNDMTVCGTGAKKKLAKHNAAHLMFEYLKSVNTKISNSCAEQSDIEQENARTLSDVSSIAFSNVDDNELEMAGKYVEENGFAIMEDVVSAEVKFKLLKIVNLYIEVYAKDLNCSTDEYLAMINHWRNPCDMISLLSLWIISTLQCKVREIVGADVVHMGTSVLKTNNRNITETNANVLATFYEFCVWIPIAMSTQNDTNTETDEYFVVETTDSDGNKTVQKYHPKMGEALICHHRTHFRFCGTKTRRSNHFYLVTEWKRHTYREMESIHRIISTSNTKPNNEMIYDTLMDGMQTIRNVELHYDLIACVLDWERILIFNEEKTAFNHITFFENFVDANRVKHTLADFLFALQALERHNGRDCDDGIHTKFVHQFMMPLKLYLSTLK